ncbi:hypothetical protein HYV85_03165 [Candidatus Woesearchaeota archaeon]|nr:hypothetical protein [Candidatus Woesearchaeota archaeon]
MATTTGGLEELLDAPEVRQLNSRERDSLIAGLNKLAAVDSKLAESWLLRLGTDLLSEGHATVVAEYALFIGNLIDRHGYSLEAIGWPVVHATADSRLPERLGLNALPLVEKYIKTLFGAAEFAQLLAQQPDFFANFPTGFRIAGKPKQLRQVMGWFKSLYALDEQVAKDAASVIARLPHYESLKWAAKDYLFTIAASVKKFGSEHKIVRALLNPDKAELIIHKLKRYPQFPFVFGSTAEAPISPSFYLVAGDSSAEEQVQANTQQMLLHQNHFDLELELLRQSMPDIVRRVGLSNRGKIGLLDACTGDGTKFARTMMYLTKAMAENGVKGTVISGLAFTDYNEYLIFEAVMAIESLGIAIDGESTGALFPRIISKQLFGEPGTEGKRSIPSLKLSLCPGNIEDLINNKLLKEFQQTYPFYITTSLGTTVCNFDPDTIARTLHNVTAEYCLVTVYVNEDNDAKLASIYSSDPVRGLSANNLAIAGVSRQDLGKFNYKVAVQRWRYTGNGYVVDPLVAVVTYFEAKERVRGALFDFEKGERAPGLLSIKPTDSQFRTIMGHNGFETVATYQLDDVALYLLRKAPMAGSSQIRGNKELIRSL